MRRATPSRRPGITPGNRDVLFRAAHDIKGQAATFGFPQVAPVADSLCRLIEHMPDIARMPLRLVDQHVDAIRAITHKNTRGDGMKYAAQLAEKLRHVTDEFLVHENRDRPDTLESIWRRCAESIVMPASGHQYGGSVTARQNPVLVIRFAMMRRVLGRHDRPAGIVGGHQIVHLDQFVAEQPRLFARSLGRVAAQQHHQRLDLAGRHAGAACQHALHHAAAQAAHCRPVAASPSSCIASIAARNAG